MRGRDSASMRSGYSLTAVHDHHGYRSVLCLEQDKYSRLEAGYYHSVWGIALCGLLPPTASCKDVVRKLMLLSICMAKHKSSRKWRAEVISLARVSHPNICKVLGFSRDDPSSSSDKVAAGVQRERLLVYEHTSNGSLESLLYCRKGRAPLDWATRIKIALGTAEGLAFLHERLPRKIIYKSFRTLNIQVDLHFNAKISDYGFASSSKELPSCSPARSLPLDDPYAAPETIMCNEVSAKSNVWSFGIVLLELLTGRQNMDAFFGPEERDLLKWCRPYLLDQKRLYLVMDPELKGRYSTRQRCLRIWHCNA